MVQFNFTYDPNISVEQRVGFELAAMIWSRYLTDDITVNLHIASSDSLGENGQAVGGAIPLFHEQNYGVYQQYAEADATSDTDTEALASQQEGNTVGFLVDGQVVDGNTDILLTSAQAKALGMDEALTLENGGIWDRNLVDANSLDGYILVSNSFDWNYDYTRSGEAPEGTLDFMSMALHEIGHQLGFVSSLDGTLDMNTLYSGETQAEGFSVLDLFRHSIDSNQVENPDGAVTDLSLGQNSYFSTDGGATNLANFANGVDYQASHWKRMQVALGIMDPTLAYTERVSLNALDLQAMDVLGWDINYNALDAGLDLDALLLLAENKVETSLGLSSTALDSSRGGGEHGDLYTLGYGEWWAIFEKYVLELGYGEWWSIFEMGYGEWQQQFGENGLELGYGEWWQAFEANVLELGYGEWWQTFESDMLQLGYGEWWQLLELGYGEWWQKLETFFSTLDKVDGNATSDKATVADGGVAGEAAKIYRGGDNDDIIAGDQKQDRIKAGAGDDLVDGKEGHDVIWGEAGNDIIYGQDGNDLISGGEDDDLLLGEADDDELHGEAGHDIVSGGSGDDIVTGGEGKDDLKGGSGNDVLDGGGGDDRLEGEANSDILIGGKGRDQIRGGSGNDVIYGDAYEGTESLNQLRTQLKQQSEETASTDTSNPDASIATGNINPIRVEVEDMLLTGDYKIEDWSNDSGNIFIVNTSAEATSTFSGPSGRYMVVARYYDKKGNSDGVIDFSFNGTLVNSVTLDKETNRFHTQTISSDIALNEGDEFSISVPAVGGEEDISIDYLEFVLLDNLLVTPLDSEQSNSSNSVSSSSVSVTSSTTGDGSSSVSVTSSTTGDGSSSVSVSSSSSSSAGNGVFRVEAEAMTLLGDYAVESNSESSNGALIGAQKRGEGIALTTFGGEAGYYNIVVGYYDENDQGIGQISAALNGETLDAWSLDQNLGDTFASSQNFLTRTVASAVLLNTDDVFRLTSLGGVNGPELEEHAYIDYVDFVKVSVSTIEQASSTVQIENTTDVSDESLVAHWTFDENSGSAVSDATGRQQAILVNTATDNTQWEQGQFGGALQLDGVNDYVAVADSSDINRAIHGQRTVSVWFKVDNTTIAERKQVIYEEGGSGRGLNLYIHDGKLYAGGWNRDSAQSNWTGTYLHTDEIVSGQWHHVSVVLDGDEQVRAGAFAAYLDGELFSVGEGSQLWSRGSDIGLGAVNDHTRFHDGTTGATGGQALAGSIDDARIYNRALDGEEILAMVGRDNDRLQGGGGDDTIFGGAGNDVLYGESLGDTSSSLLRGAQTYNGHTYLLSELGSWEEAQLQAQRLGGNLVTLNDAAEESWIQDVFSASERLWTGFSDAVTEGEWQWVSGEAVTYTNWAPGEPNDDQGGQDFGTINYNNQWDDTQINGYVGHEGWQEGIRGVIEITTTDNDILVGGSGDDALYGNGGDDELYGDSLDNRPSSSLGNGLVGHWTFDETSGLQAGDSTGSNTGSLTDMTSNQWTTGAVEGALNFDGNNDYVLVADTAELDITQTLTLATWVNADTFKNWDGLIVKGTSNIPYGLNFTSDGRLSFSANYSSVSDGSGDGTWYSTTGVTAGQWQHVAVTYNGSAVQFYIDGQLDSTYQANITFGTNNEALVLGGDLAGGSLLDDARVYNRALSAEEIAQLTTGEGEVSGSGEGGNDFLYGGIGSDTLEGGAGNDVLDGSDEIAAGYFEKDILRGGLGADTFILGNANQAYYLGGGDKDFALIQDFNAAEDVVQLHGSASDYTQQQQGNDTFLYHQGSSSELVAVFETVENVNLNTGFVFV